MVWPKVSISIDDPHYDMFAITRLLSNIKREGNCWIWTGTVNERGYGTIGYKNKTWSVHRISYLLIGGKPLTPGLVLDHLCRNRPCINPNHLEEVTNKENILRGNGFGAINARKTECNYGHKLVNDNVYHHPDGSRECHKCRKSRKIKNLK